MRKTFWIVLAALSALCIAAPAGEGKRDKITVAYHPHIVGVGGLLNAIDNGHFAKENLEVELVQFTSGAVELAAMASGQIDLGFLGGGAHVFAPQGQCQILALDSTDVSSEIMVRADSGIKSMADLKGKNVGISSGTTSEMILTMALKHAGMDPNDVNKINMDAAGKVTAFMTGSIDAICIESPYTDKIRQDMGADKALTISGAAFLPGGFFPSSWVTTNAFLEKRPDLVVRFLKAWLQGTQERSDHLQETINKVAKFINVDPVTVGLYAEKATFFGIADQKRIFSDGTALKWYNTGKQQFLDAGLLDKKFDVPPETFVKPQYVLQAIQELGF